MPNYVLKYANIVQSNVSSTIINIVRRVQKAAENVLKLAELLLKVKVFFFCNFFYKCVPL